MAGENGGEGKENLRQSEERFKLLVESVRDYAIFMLDPKGHVLTWNAGAQRFKGYRPEEIIGQHFSRFYPPEEVARGLPEHELQVASKEGAFEDEGWRVRKDGSLFWANVVITAMRDKEGELVGFAKVTRDLTQRRAQE
jgi:PAS domain S-box-containing protein